MPYDTVWYLCIYRAVLWTRWKMIPTVVWVITVLPDVSSNTSNLCFANLVMAKEYRCSPNVVSLYSHDVEALCTYSWDTEKNVKTNSGEAQQNTVFEFVFTETRARESWQRWSAASVLHSERRVVVCLVPSPAVEDDRRWNIKVICIVSFTFDSGA